MPEPTVEQILSLDSNKPAKRHSVIGPILAFFLIPPLGVYLLWKEKSWHRIFALLSIVLGIANLFSAVSIYLTVFPKLGELYSQLNLTHQINSAYIIIYGVLSIGQIFISFYFWKTAKRKSFLETWELVILAILTLLVDFVVLPIIIGIVVLLPIYQLDLEPYKSFPAN